MASNLQTFTLFYDGACPLCQAEILFLSKRNEAGLLNFVDINSALYDSQKIGITCEQALAAMYGQFASGKLIQGVAVFPEAYRRANLPRMARIFSSKPLQPFLKLGYLFFAKNRHAISSLLGPAALRLVKSKSSSS